MTKLLLLGSAVAAGAVYVKKHRASRELSEEPRPSARDDLGSMIPDADIIEEVVVVGVTGYDPDLMR